MPTPLITCEDVSFAYERQTVVQHVSFVLEKGDYLCVVGENGAGKSTLIKGILGLLKPTGGHITYHGLAPREIGYLPQQTIVQRDFPASVWEVVLSGCLNRTGPLPFYGKEAKGRAKHEIEHLGLAHLAKRSYRELSGGQQQRVLLARALCATEKLLLLDEPVAGLDPIVTAEMYTLIEQMKSEHDVTILMISHDIRSAVRYGNKILQLQRGGVFFGSTEEYAHTAEGRRMLGGDAL